MHLTVQGKPGLKISVQKQQNVTGGGAKRAKKVSRII
jgi:hypothetical protein